MHVFVTGASGLVGQAYVRHALAAGWRVTAASRSQRQWPAGVQGVQWPGGRLDLSGCDVVVHLAGASIAGRRWNDAYMQELRSSRIETTRQIAEAMQPGQVLVCASAVGYYGIDPQGACPESRAPGTDFLAQLCVDWETAAAEAPGRHVSLRLGHVLAPRDGILSRLVPLHKAWVAGVIGKGTQELGWIHVDDLARVIHWAATSPIEGAVNAVADAAPYRTWHEALCNRVGGFKRLRIPSFALRLGVGRFAPYLIGGQQVVAERLHREGPTFEWPEFQEALEACLTPS